MDKQIITNVDTVSFNIYTTILLRNEKTTHFLLVYFFCYWLKVLVTIYVSKGQVKQVEQFDCSHRPQLPVQLQQQLSIEY